MPASTSARNGRKPRDCACLRVGSVDGSASLLAALDPLTPLRFSLRSRRSDHLVALGEGAGGALDLDHELGPLGVDHPPQILVARPAAGQRDQLGDLADREAEVPDVAHGLDAGEGALVVAR
jgi:hypothetical protein